MLSSRSSIGLQKYPRVVTFAVTTQYSMKGHGLCCNNFRNVELRTSETVCFIFFLLVTGNTFLIWNILSIYCHQAMNILSSGYDSVNFFFLIRTLYSVNQDTKSLMLVIMFTECGVRLQDFDLHCHNLLKFHCLVVFLRFFPFNFFPWKLEYSLCLWHSCCKKYSTHILKGLVQNK